MGLTQRFHSGSSRITDQDIWGLLQLMQVPQEARQLLLDAREAEKASRAALAELATAQKKVTADEASNTKKAAELAELERRLGEDRAKMEAVAAQSKASLAVDRRNLDAEREDLQERIGRQQALDRESAARKDQLDSRETVIAAQEKELAARHASFEEVAAVLSAKGLAGKK